MSGPTEAEGAAGSSREWGGGGVETDAVLAHTTSKKPTYLSVVFAGPRLMPQASDYLGKSVTETE